MVLDKKTYNKLCKKCRKRTKHLITSPSPPPAKKRSTDSNKSTLDVCGDLRVLARKHFQKLLSKNKQGKTRNNVPWSKLSQVLVQQRQCLINWPINFAFHDGIKILKLSTAECKQLLTVKIKKWSIGKLIFYNLLFILNSLINSLLLDENIAFKKRSKQSQTIPIVINVDGTILISVGEITPYKEMLQTEANDTDSTLS